VGLYLIRESGISSLCGWGQNSGAGNISVTIAGHGTHIGRARARFESKTGMSEFRQCLLTVTALALASGAVADARDRVGPGERSLIWTGINFERSL